MQLFRFFMQCILLYCSLIRSFVCQTYVRIILELHLFLMEKDFLKEFVDLIVVFLAMEFVLLVSLCLALF